MKVFHYNTIVNREDFADRDQDIDFLTKTLKKGHKIALYAPRRYGKTSLAQNIIPQELRTQDTAHLFVDFMDCASVDSVTSRLLEAYSITLKTYFKKNYLLENAKKFLKNLTLGVSTHPMTGEFSIELTTQKGEIPRLSDILESISYLCDKKRTLLVFDEFQDITDLPEVIAIFRSHLQKLGNTPMLFLGSKRKLLSQIFASQHSPLFGFADEHVLGPIPLKDWIPFFEERLKPVKTKIEEAALRRLCDEALNVPNAICEMGSFIQENFGGCTITEDFFLKILDELIQKKSESYRYQLSLLTLNELNICKALAQNRFTKQINAKKFLFSSKANGSSINKSIKKLYRAGVVEEESQGFRISNPILSLFLKYRTY